MIDIPDVPATLHSERERGRIQGQGRCTDDGSNCTLLIIHEANGVISELASAGEG